MTGMRTLSGSTAAGSSWGTTGETLILKSDAQKFLRAEQRTPKGLQSPVFAPVRSSSFVERVESLKEARRHSSSELIPKSQDEVVRLLTAKLKELGLDGKWRIPRATRKLLEQELNIDTHTFMENIVVVAQHLAVPVISVFHVGAAALGGSGDVYLGTNVEISSGIYASNVCGFHYCLHAEQAAILNMFDDGEEYMASIYISHAPCGVCRQFMCELPDYRKIKIWTPQISKVVSLAELLPHSFGPVDLGMSRTLIPWGKPNPVSLHEASEAHDVCTERAKLAESAAQRAHAPYTHSYAGAVIRLKNGKCVCGSSAESAAFNPSVSPLLMALLSLWVHGGDVQDIESACLAEDPTSQITYKGSDGALLAAVAPWASLWLMPLDSTEPAS